MITDNGKHYLYRHIRLDNGKPFYIGVGTKNSKLSPYYRAETVKHRNHLWSAIYNKTSIEVEILLESDNPDFVRDKEKEFIGLYGRIIKGDGILTNMDNGGYGERRKTVDVKAAAAKRMAEMNKRTAKDRVGVPQYYKGIRMVYIYSLDGKLLHECKSGMDAVRILGFDNKHMADLIIRKLDKKSSYKGYFYSATKQDFIDTSSFRVNDDSKDYKPKKVAKISSTGEIEKIYNTIKEAAKDIGMHKDAFRIGIAKNKKMRKGIFKIITE